MVENIIGGWARPPESCLIECKRYKRCRNKSLLPPDLLFQLGIIAKPEEVSKLNEELAKIKLEIGSYTLGRVPNQPEHQELTGQVIKERAGTVAKEIVGDYKLKNETFTLMVVKNGARVWAGLLYEELAELRAGCEIDDLKVKSYGDTSSGEIKYEQEPYTDIKNKNIILVEDIVDSGQTLDFLLKDMAKKGAASVKICAMLNKPESRKKDFRHIRPHYYGFDIDKDFVVGMGLDYNELGRNFASVFTCTPCAKDDFPLE